MKNLVSLKILIMAWTTCRLYSKKFSTTIINCISHTVWIIINNNFRLWICELVIYLIFIYVCYNVYKNSLYMFLLLIKSNNLWCIILIFLSFMEWWQLSLFSCSSKNYVKVVFFVYNFIWQKYCCHIFLR